MVAGEKSRLKIRKRELSRTTLSTNKDRPDQYSGKGDGRALGLRKQHRGCKGKIGVREKRELKESRSITSQVGLGGVTGVLGWE